MLKDCGPAAEHLNYGTDAHMVIVGDIADSDRGGNVDVETVQKIDVRVAQRDVYETSGGERASGHEIEFGVGQFDRFRKHKLRHSHSSSFDGILEKMCLPICTAERLHRLVVRKTLPIYVRSRGKFTFN